MYRCSAEQEGNRRDYVGWQKGFGLGWGSCNCSGWLHYTAKTVVLLVLIKPQGTIYWGSWRKFGWEQKRNFNVLIPRSSRNFQVPKFWDSSIGAKWPIRQSTRPLSFSLKLTDVCSTLQDWVLLMQVHYYIEIILINCILLYSCTITEYSSVCPGRIQDFRAVCEEYPR